MTLMPRPGCDRNVGDVAVVYRCKSSLERETCLPAGHCLSRARARHLRESDWVIVTDDSVPVGLAAYKYADSDVRVVHELLVDRTLPAPDAARVIDALILALEMLACDEGVDCLMFLLYGDVMTSRFEAHDYSLIVAERCGAWVQKKLEALTWARNSLEYCAHDTRIRRRDVHRGKMRRRSSCLATSGAADVRRVQQLKQGVSRTATGDLLEELRLALRRALKWAEAYEPPRDRRRAYDADRDAAESAVGEDRRARVILVRR